MRRRRKGLDRSGDNDASVDLRGHYLDSLLERKTEELQRKTAELEALNVKQA